MTHPTSPAAARAAGPGAFDRWLTRTALVTGGTVLLTMTLLCVINVLVMRKFLAAPIAGAEDVLILLLVTFVALSIPFGARTGAHIEIEVVSELLPAWLARGLQVVARFASAAFLGLMAWQLAEAGHHAVRFGEVTQQLEISYQPFYYLLAFCFGVFAVLQAVDGWTLVRTGQVDVPVLEEDQ